MSFFGLEVTSTSMAWIDASEDAPVQITSACLVSGGKSRRARVAIKMYAGPDEETPGPPPVIGVLSEAGVENLRLEHLINAKMGVKLVGAGAEGAVVHLTGHVIDTTEEDEDEVLRNFAQAQGINLSGSESDSDSDSQGDDHLEALFGGSESDDDEEAGEGSTAVVVSSSAKRDERLAGKKGSGGSADSEKVDAAKIVKHPSGLQYQDLLVGTGKSAVVGKNVAMKYTLRLESGKVVDKSGKAPFKCRIGCGEVVKGRTFLSVPRLFRLVNCFFDTSCDWKRQALN